MNLGIELDGILEKKMSYFPCENQTERELRDLCEINLCDIPNATRAKPLAESSLL